MRGEMILISPPIDDKKSECHDGKQKRYCETHSEQEQAHIGDNEADTTTLAPGQYLQGTAFKFRTLEEIVRLEPGIYNDGLLASFEIYDGSHPTLPSISLTSLDVNRWKMAWCASQLYKEDDELRLCYRRRFLLERYENWPDLQEVLDEIPIALGFTTAALIYGGLHALAWFAHLDSYTEQPLWRIFRVRGDGWASPYLRFNQICSSDYKTRVIIEAVYEMRRFVSASGVLHVGIGVRTNTSVSGRRMLH